MIGRFAPSPTGTFHLGNLRTALAAWLFARAAGSSHLLRWEDLDDTASPQNERRQIADLVRLGIDWDEPPMRQSERIEVYEDVLADLRRRDLVYPCWCSRREVREAAAPHDPPGRYPGTCRTLDASARRERIERGRPPAIRLKADDATVTVHDRLHGTHTEVVDDFVLQRFDGTFAYNLVVVVDDAAQGVEEVVRGDDLLAHTPRHALLQRVLGLPEPVWSHVPLVVDRTGHRLAKRDGSLSLDQWEQAGGSVASLVSTLGRSLGVADADAERAADLLPGFDPARIPLRPLVASENPVGLSLLD